MIDQKIQYDARSGYLVRRGAAVAASGLSASYRATVIFDTSTTDRTGVSNKTVAAHPQGVFLPLGAVISKVQFQVKTAFTSVDSTATIAFTAQTAADCYAATAVSGNPGTTGFYAGIPDGTVTHMISLTAEREINVTVGVEALTAGKALIIVDYFIGL